MSPPADMASISAARAIAPRAVSAPLAIRLGRTVAWTVALGLLVLMGWDLGVRPERLSAGLTELGRFVGLMWPPTSNGNMRAILAALVETLGMAIAGTVMVVALAAPLSLLAAKTVVSQPVLHFVIRRVLDVLRGVPTLVWALVLVAAFGLGPRVGVIALVLAETPQAVKIFAEVMENSKVGPIESLRASGAGLWQTLRYGLIPQVLPVLTGFALYLFEINIRASAALGVVGAGGIGAELDDRIRLLRLDEVAFILVLYIILVIVIDVISQHVRGRLARA